MIDNDKPALAVSPTAMDVDEGDAAGQSFSVRLATAPSAEVMVSISGHTGTDVTPVQDKSQVHDEQLGDRPAGEGERR